MSVAEEMLSRETPPVVDDGQKDSSGAAAAAAGSVSGSQSSTTLLSASNSMASLSVLGKHLPDQLKDRTKERQDGRKGKPMAS